MDEDEVDEDEVDEDDEEDEDDEDDEEDEEDDDEEDEEEDEEEGGESPISATLRLHPTLGSDNSLMTLRNSLDDSSKYSWSVS